MPRKSHKYHYIYKITNNLSGRYYWGMHSCDNLSDGYMGSGKRIVYSIKKHGKENHTKEIIEFCNSREELGKRETEIVNLNELAKIECMNLRVGGLGGERPAETVPWNKGIKAPYSKESLLKMSISQKARKDNSWVGRTHSEESKKKMSESHKGQVSTRKGIPMDEATRKKISESVSGENHPNFGKSSGMKGKTHSEETLLKMKETRQGSKNSFFGRKHSEETKQKIAESRKLKKIFA